MRTSGTDDATPQPWNDSFGPTKFPHCATGLVVQEPRARGASTFLSRLAHLSGSPKKINKYGMFTVRIDTCHTYMHNILHARVRLVFYCIPFHHAMLLNNGAFLGSGARHHGQERSNEKKKVLCAPCLKACALLTVRVIIRSTGTPHRKLWSILLVSCIYRQYK